MSILSALTVTMAGPRIVKPQAAVITFKNLRFYITDQPSERRIETFVQVILGLFSSLPQLLSLMYYRMCSRFLHVNRFQR